MKLLTKFRIVFYFGIKLWIPKNFNYLATDRDGRVYAYENKPEPSDDVFLGTLPHYLGEVDLEDQDWTESLVEYKMLTKKELKAYYKSFNKSGWFATDKDGEVYHFEEEPYLDGHYWMANTSTIVDHNENIKFKKSLMKIK
jgi:hypothetical protein